MKTGSCFVAVSLVSALSAFGQAPSPTASQGMHLNVFGVGSYVKPAFQNARDGFGFSVGGSLGFTVPGLHHIEPALEGRYSYARSASAPYIVPQAVSESVPSVGIRVTWHASRFHPYGNLLIGPGTIRFLGPVLIAPNYTQNNSLVWTYGGGLDYDLTRSWAVRAEVQGEHWKLSSTDPAFHPLRAGVGVRYQFHFRNRFGPE
ncbi:MAG: outer membrane beta-barrel protein [Terriglobus sp.]